MIEIKGARANNLKNIDVKLPEGEFIVVTGVSGSGKSSLAFDTLYAEGRRRYVESLSAYARQFLGRIPKPECDYILGLPPAIAIEQKNAARNPRSTVGTTTEINDYLRMLFARIGHTMSPVSRTEVKRHTPESITEEVLKLPVGTRIAVLSPVILPDKRTFTQQLEVYFKEGYTRIYRGDEQLEIADMLTEAGQKTPRDAGYYRLLIDRLAIGEAADSDKDFRARLADSLETAYFEGHDECSVLCYMPDGQKKELRFSNRFEADGLKFREPSELMFNFNNPYGACTKCEGFGNVLGISEDLVVPDKTLSVYQGAVQCWNGDKMGEWRNELISRAAELKFPIHTPYMDLSKKERDVLWHGSGSWRGIDGFFRYVDMNQYKIQYRVLKSRYRGRTVCPVCHGRRLKPSAQFVKIAGHSIGELLEMPVKNLRTFFADLQLPAAEQKIAARLLKEIYNRLSYLDDVGLGYLTLSRPWATLSGGESQRIKLATSLGSSLVGSLYVLDEPSIGLHPRDTQRLISVLRHLKEIGNTVLVVEHDEEIMRAADYLVDIGPDAGAKGGELIYAGPLKEAVLPDTADRYPLSKTLAQLSGRDEIPVPDMRRPWRKYIMVEGARHNNLKDVSVKFPLGVLTVVTGVSGSGKSSLVRDVLYLALNRRILFYGDRPGNHKALSGNTDAVDALEFVDQNPIGASTRSNAATYLGFYDEIRALFASLPLSKQMRFTSSYFSFNTDGGRCEDCKGEGVITIPMQFMADMQLKCETCGGSRFKREILEVKYRGKNISDILAMTAGEAHAFFSEDDNRYAKKITKLLEPLLDVGLGYLPLGQPSSTLSGGENQRLKLAFFLGRKSDMHTLFILDEPTTGLHTADISTLLGSLRKLIDNGNTVLVIEHNMHVAKSADWIIDMGPDGGEAGGQVVAEGTPEQVAANPLSATGPYLAAVLNR